MALEKFQVKIGGMACSFCAETIKKGLGRTEGVSEVNVSLAHEEALIAYDAAKVKDGDVLPGFILNTKTDGSADDLNASGSWANGVWTMTVWRKLDTKQKDDVALAAGQTYPMGLAVHDDNVTTRFHYVSLPLKLSLGKKEGHINAVELK